MEDKANDHVASQPDTEGKDDPFTGKNYLLRLLHCSSSRLSESTILGSANPSGLPPLSRFRLPVKDKDSWHLPCLVFPAKRRGCRETETPAQVESMFAFGHHAGELDSEKEIAMHCTRCRGLMVRDQFYDLLDDNGHLSFRGWRCVCCGNVLDPVILRNKRLGKVGFARPLA